MCADEELSSAKAKVAISKRSFQKKSPPEWTTPVSTEHKLKRKVTRNISKNNNDPQQTIPPASQKPFLLAPRRSSFHAIGEENRIKLQMRRQPLLLQQERVTNDPEQHTKAQPQPNTATTIHAAAVLDNESSSSDVILVRTPKSQLRPPSSPPHHMKQSDETVVWLMPGDDCAHLPE